MTESFINETCRSNAAAFMICTGFGLVEYSLDAVTAYGLFKRPKSTHHSYQHSCDRVDTNAYCSYRHSSVREHSIRIGCSEAQVQSRPRDALRVEFCRAALPRLEHALTQIREVR